MRSQQNVGDHTIPFTWIHRFSSHRLPFHNSVQPGLSAAVLRKKSLGYRPLSSERKATKVTHFHRGPTRTQTLVALTAPELLERLTAYLPLFLFYCHLCFSCILLFRLFAPPLHVEHSKLGSSLLNIPACLRDIWGLLKFTSIPPLHSLTWESVLYCMTVFGTIWLGFFWIKNNNNRNSNNNTTTTTNHNNPEISMKQERRY